MKNFLPSKWMGGCLLIFLASAMVFRFFDDILNDPAMANVIVKVALILSFILYLVWFLVGSIFSKKIKGSILVIVVGLMGVFLVRYEIIGWDGNMNPVLVERGLVHENGPDSLKPLWEKVSTIEFTESFTQFMGDVGRSGIRKGPELQTDWKAFPPKEKWRRKIGEGLGGFVIEEDHAIIMEQRGDEEFIVSYDRSTGHPRWFHREKVRHESVLGGVGPRSTASISEGHVYVIGGTGLLTCLNLLNGKLIWQKNLLKEIGSDLNLEAKNVPWGRSGSVLILNDLVLVPGGGANGKYHSLLAFHKKNGELVWAKGDSQISYASPQKLTLLGVEQIVIVNEATVTSHAIETGNVLWEVALYGKSSSNANSSQVCKISDHELILSKAYNTGARLITLSKNEDKWQVEVTWKNRRSLRTKFSSSIFMDDFKVVGLNERDLQAIDARTGKEIWEGKRYGYGQILRYNDKLFVLSETGELALVDLNQGKELAKLKVLKGKTWCSIALAGNDLYVRNNTEAVCYELKLK